MATEKSHIHNDKVGGNMKKNISILLFAICCLILSSCSTSFKEQEMPEIVFMYESEHYTKETYKGCFVDNQGNIFYSENTELKQYTVQTLIDMYRKGELDELWELCGSVEMEELQTYYKKLLKMYNNEFELTPDSYGIDAIVDEEYWSGMYYDKEHEIKGQWFFMDGATKYTPSDEVALEIVEWMDTLMEGIVPKD